MLLEPDTRKGALLLLRRRKKRGRGLGFRLQPCLEGCGIPAGRQDCSTGLGSARAAARCRSVTHGTIQLMEGAGCKVSLRPCLAAKHPLDTSTRPSPPPNPSLQILLNSQAEGLPSPAPFAPDPAPLRTISDAPTGTNIGYKMPTSSNPTIPSSDFQPFCPLPLLPSTAFKQRSQVQQGLKLCLFLLFVQQPHRYHLPVVSLDPCVSPAGLAAQGCLLPGSAGPSLRTPLQM